MELLVGLLLVIIMVSTALLAREIDTLLCNRHVLCTEHQDKFRDQL